MATELGTCPPIFDPIRGHVPQLTTLASLPTGNSFIFFGPESIGKFLVASQYALFLNCKRGGCGECQSCTMESHLNIHVIEPTEGRINIAATREAIGLTTNSPWGSGHHVFIVRDAHTLSEASASPLLKAVEDRSSRTTWILITHDIDRLLPAMKSRCLVVRFSRLQESEVQQLFEDLEAPPACSKWITACDGVPGLALKLWKTELDNCYAQAAAMLAAIAARTKLHIIFKMVADMLEGSTRAEIETAMLDILTRRVSGREMTWVGKAYDAIPVSWTPKAMDAMVRSLASHPTTKPAFVLKNMVVQMRMARA